MSMNVGTLLTGIVAAANSIQKLGEDWYAASEDWKKFPVQIENLRKKYDQWQDQATNFGLAQDRRLKDPLDAAKRQLEEEMKELLNKTGPDGQLHRGTGFLYKVKVAVFPAQLGQRLNDVTAAFDNIPKILDEEKKNTTAMQEMVLAGKTPLRFSRDPRYVRLQNTERSVRMKLMKPDGPKLVLLYGGTGRGKSTLAQDLALQIDSPEDDKSDALHHQNSVTSSHGEHVAGGAPNQQLSQAFERVVYLTCGRDVQLLALQRELRQKLGWNERELPKNLGPDDSDRGEADSHLDLERSLAGLLHSQKVLLIFDDVSSKDLDMLQSMISLCGKNVKCLVTSQDQNLCHLLNCKYECVPMEKASTTDGRNIFASHVFGSEEMKDKPIPIHVEGRVNTLIEKIDGNLLAMACLATAIDKESFNDERAWEKLADDFLEFLGEKQTAKIHNDGYKDSFWAAMEISFEKLTREEKMLLILVSLFRGPSVPQEIVEYFYTCLKQMPLGLSQFFSRARAQLEAKQLIQVDRTQVLVEHISIHSLVKEFTDKKGRTDDLNVLKTLRELSESFSDRAYQIAESESEVDITIVLLGLYLDEPDFAEKVVHYVDDLSTLHDRRYVIEPLARWLVLNKDKHVHCASKRVFLHYVQHGQIHPEETIALLKASMPRLPMVNVLERLAVKDYTVDISVGEAVLITLLKLLGEKQSRDQKGILSSISLAFFNLYIKCKKQIVDPGNAFSSRVLEELTDALQTDTDREIQLDGLRGLSRVVIVDCIAQRISDYPGTLDKLIECLSIRDHAPGHAPGHSAEFFKYAAKALSRLARRCGQKGCEMIVRSPIVVQELLKPLTTVNNPGLQGIATEALAELANQGGLQVVEKISNDPGALRALVNALTRDDNLDLQTHSARALEILARNGGNTIALKISDTEDGVQNLADSLTNDENPQLQIWAASALHSLAEEGGHVVSEKICKAHGLVETLVRLLSKVHNPNVQRKSARVLATLAYQGGRGVRHKIFHISRACKVLADVVLMAEENVNSGSLLERTEWFAMRALTLVDPEQAQALPLKSASAYLGRGRGEVVLELYEEALKDFNDAWRIQALRPDIVDREKAEILSYRVIAKAKLGSLQGALEDADTVIQLNRKPFGLQERGVVKHMMGDYPGALVDLDEGLQLDPDNYERLKHRGYVKFCMKDDDGARADAKRALEIKPPRIDFISNGCTFLGRSSVQYLEYQLP